MYTRRFIEHAKASSRCGSLCFCAIVLYQVPWKSQDTICLNKQCLFAYTIKQIILIEFIYNTSHFTQQSPWILGILLQGIDFGDGSWWNISQNLRERITW